jgi:hypothetical protein
MASNAWWWLPSMGRSLSAFFITPTLSVGVYGPYLIQGSSGSRCFRFHPVIMCSAGPSLLWIGPLFGEDTLLQLAPASRAWSTGGKVLCVHLALGLPLSAQKACFVSPFEVPASGGSQCPAVTRGSIFVRHTCIRSQSAAVRRTRAE